MHISGFTCDTLSSLNVCLDRRISESHIHPSIHIYIHTYIHLVRPLERSVRSHVGYLAPGIHSGRVLVNKRYIYIYIYTHTHTHMNTHIHKYRHRYIHRYIHSHICVHTHMCMHAAQSGAHQLESRNEGGRREPRAAETTRQTTQGQRSAHDLCRMAARRVFAHSHTVGSIARHHSPRGV
jgi:hypothetical protein